MNPVSPDVLVIGGDTRVQRVSLAGVEYELRPMSVPQIERFVREGGPELINALGAVFAGETRPDWAAVVEQHEARLRAVLSDASKVPREAIEALDSASLIQFTNAVLDLNLDFFVQRVRPALGQLMRTMSRLAPLVSARTSQTALRH